VFSILNDLLGDAAFVAQTFGGLEHQELLEVLDTPSRIHAYVSATEADLANLRSFGVPEEKLHRLNPPVYLDQFGGVSQA
ncbi:MAG: hypothetical protein ABEI86_11970, partial [Halobacteriaceae archaeon]